MLTTNERTETVTGRKVGRYCSASSAWRFEQAGDFSDGFGTWADVPHRGTRVAVPGLGHDQLQRDALLAEVGGRGVAQLVQSIHALRTEVLRSDEDLLLSGSTTSLF